MLSNRYTAIIRTDIYLVCKPNLHLLFLLSISYPTSSPAFFSPLMIGKVLNIFSLLVISILPFENHISTSLPYLLIALFGFLL